MQNSEHTAKKHYCSKKWKSTVVRKLTSGVEREVILFMKKENVI